MIEDCCLEETKEPFRWLKHKMSVSIKSVYRNYFSAGFLLCFVAVSLNKDSILNEHGIWRFQTTIVRHCLQ